jgi:5-methylcytosine-specific restriction endonuclease McrA
MWRGGRAERHSRESGPKEASEIMSSMEAVIVLNAGYEFMGLVSWQRAMGLLFSGKVEVVKESEKTVRTVTRTFRIPAVVRLIKFIRQIYRREVPFSRKNVLVRDSHVCQYCGRDFTSGDLTVDHIIPKVQGGANSWTNVVACCRSCNVRKGGRTPRQAGMQLVGKPFKPTIMEFINLYLKRRFGADLSEILQF